MRCLGRVLAAPHTLLLSLLLVSGALTADDKIYKWVDKDGHVTYSSKPPPKGSARFRVVPLAPAPTEAEVEAARQRHEGIKQRAEQLEQDRKEREAKAEEEARAAEEAQRQQSGQQAPPAAGQSQPSDVWLDNYQRRPTPPPRPERPDRPRPQPLPQPR
jgi:Domain of unknown function (DUF4124)